LLALVGRLVNVPTELSYGFALVEEVNRFVVLEPLFANDFEEFKDQSENFFVVCDAICREFYLHRDEAKSR